jgi:hypothetical protein
VFDAISDVSDAIAGATDSTAEGSVTGSASPAHTVVRSDGGAPTSATSAADFDAFVALCDAMNPPFAGPSVVTGARSVIADHSDGIPDRYDVTPDGTARSLDVFAIAIFDSAAFAAWSDAATDASAGHCALLVDPREWLRCT